MAATCYKDPDQLLATSSTISLCAEENLFLVKKKGPSKSLLYFCPSFYTHPYIYIKGEDGQRGEGKSHSGNGPEWIMPVNCILLPDPAEEMNQIPFFFLNNKSTRRPFGKE